MGRVYLAPRQKRLQHATELYWSALRVTVLVGDMIQFS